MTIASYNLTDLISITAGGPNERRTVLRHLFNAEEDDLRRDIASCAASGKLPDSVTVHLIAAGLPRLLLPSKYGGLQAPPASVLLIIEELARISGSLGWTSMVMCETPILLLLFPRSTFEAIYSSGPDVLLSSSSIPAGRAVEVPGGWSISGTWPFSTGSAHCQLFLAYSVTASGIVLASLHPAKDIHRLDDWHTTGLRSTSSNSVQLKDAFTPTLYTIPAQSLCSFDSTAMSASPSEHFSLQMAATALGILQHAIELTRVRVFQVSGTSPKREFEDVALLAALGKSITIATISRASLQDSIQQLLRRSKPITKLDHVSSSACLCVARYVVEMCLGAVTSLFELSGSTVIFDSSELLGCLCDLRCIGQHANLSPGRFAQLGFKDIRYSAD